MSAVFSFIYSASNCHGKHKSSTYEETMAEVAESQFKQMTIDSENAPPPETPSAKKAPAAGGGNLRDQLQDKIIARMEKEKGRTLTKHEMTTTIKALMKYNSKKRKSLKKRENKKKQKTEGEGAEDEVESEEEEIDFDMDEDELEAFKARKSKTQTYQNNTLPKRARMHLRHSKNKADRLLKIAKKGVAVNLQSKCLTKDDIILIFMVFAAPEDLYKGTEGDVKIEIRKP